MLLKETGLEQNVSMTKYKVEPWLNIQINEKKGSSNCFVIPLLQDVFLERPISKTPNKRWVGSFWKTKLSARVIRPYTWYNFFHLFCCLDCEKSTQTHSRQIEAVQESYDGHNHRSDQKLIGKEKITTLINVTISTQLCDISIANSWNYLDALEYLVCILRLWCLEKEIEKKQNIGGRDA